MELNSARDGMEVVAISTPGPSAVREAMDALRAGRHMVLLSTGVTLTEEEKLKRKASKHGSLLLGPGCGTSILDGKGFGIWNSVRRGPIGIVCTAGSGLQALSCMVDEVGVSHALGVGPRDLSQKINARGTLSALKFLAADEGTKVIVVVAQAPTSGVARKVIGAARGTKKPAVVCFLGDGGRFPKSVAPAQTLEEAAAHAVSLAKGRKPRPVRFRLTPEFEQVAERDYSRFGYGQHYIRGLYSGGMLCTEAQLILGESIGGVRSNVPIKPRLRLPDPRSSRGHACVDLGTPELSGGKHPAVDLGPRCERLLKEARDWEAAVVLLDVVLGNGAHLDPAGELARAVEEAKRVADRSGGYLSVVASIIGTTQDPQNLAAQREILERAGVVVQRSNAQAARMAALIATEGRPRKKESVNRVKGEGTYLT